MGSQLVERDIRIASGSPEIMPNPLEGVTTPRVCAAIGTELQ
jgi:hypothetical protein